MGSRRGREAVVQSKNSSNNESYVGVPTVAERRQSFIALAGSAEGKGMVKMEEGLGFGSLVGFQFRPSKANTSDTPCIIQVNTL